jgi:hypothetical protein
MITCHGCGILKDQTILEIYPYPEEDSLCDEPIEPTLELDCCPNPGSTGDRGWKKVTVCHECFHKLQPDMWISEQCWEKINPTTLFDQLPPLYGTLA